jgi:hypothetical protein
MDTRGELRIDPGSLDTAGTSGEFEVTVPYTDPEVTSAVLERAALLAAGLKAQVHLIAVHTAPYPLPFGCPAAEHASLVERLVDLASHCRLPVRPQVVLARYWNDGFQYALKPESTVVIGARGRLWQTQEEKLARRLAHEGHKVVLLHIA